MKDLPKEINGIKGANVINIKYVSIPIAAAAIKHFALFPCLSTNFPVIGINTVEIKKGKAIAIPTK